MPNNALRPASSGSFEVSIPQTIHIDSRSDQASIMQAMAAAKNAAIAEIKANLIRGGDMTKLVGR